MDGRACFGQRSHGGVMLNTISLSGHLLARAKRQSAHGMPRSAARTLGTLNSFRNQDPITVGESSAMLALLMCHWRLPPFPAMGQRLFGASTVHWHQKQICHQHRSVPKRDQKSLFSVRWQFPHGRAWWTCHFRQGTVLCLQNLISEWATCCSCGRWLKRQKNQ